MAGCDLSRHADCWLSYYRSKIHSGTRLAWQAYWGFRPISELRVIGDPIPSYGCRLWINACFEQSALIRLILRYIGAHDEVAGLQARAAPVPEREKVKPWYWVDYPWVVSAVRLVEDADAGVVARHGERTYPKV